MRFLFVFLICMLIGCHKNEIVVEINDSTARDVYLDNLNKSGISFYVREDGAFVISSNKHELDERMSKYYEWEREHLVVKDSSD